MTKIDTDQEAYREGLFVRALGRPCSSNPYPPNSKENVLWEKGWRLIDTHSDGAAWRDSPVTATHSVPEFTPGVASAQYSKECLQPPKTGVTRSHRLVDLAIVLAFLAMLFGMWMEIIR